MYSSVHDGQASSQAMQNATRPFRDAVERALRGGRNWVALVVHLSGLPPPGPRPFHRRIARSVLDEAAARHTGQLFTLPNGDIVLLYATDDGGAELSATLGGLFASDVPILDQVLFCFGLPDEAEPLFGWLDSAEAPDDGGSLTDQDFGLAVVSSITEAVRHGRIRDVMERQTGVLVAPSGDITFVPLFREIRFSLAALEMRAVMAGHMKSDPFLFSHLMARLGPAMLDSIIADLREPAGPLGWTRLGRPALHLALSLESINSARFRALAAILEAERIKAAVVISMVDAISDLDVFLDVRRKLQARGIGLVLDQFCVHSLQMIQPSALRVDMVKVQWSQQLQQSGTQVADAIAAVGAARIVLVGADGEAAIRWGVTHGIRRFQGKQVDAILAASRMKSCADAAACTLRRCTDRETAVTGAARAGCTNLRLLDAAVLGPLKEVA